MDLLRLPGRTGDVIEKRATTPADVARLRREQATLERLSGIAGVPTVVRAADEPPTLAVVAVDGPSALEAEPLPTRSLAVLAVALAEVLAELHAAGVVHGAVEPGHVLLGADGPFLCGFGGAGDRGAPAPDDRTRTLEPADDVAGWGETLAHLLGYAALGGPDPARPRRRQQAGALDDAAVHERLAALADDARHPDPGLRPSAEALAAAVRHRVGAALAPPDLGPPPPGPAPRRRVPSVLARRAQGGLLERLTPTPVPDAGPSAEEPGAPTPPRVPAPVLAAAVGVAAVVLVAAGPAAVAGLRPQGPTLGAEPLGAPCAPVAGSAADVDGDGCDEPVSWAGGVLSAGTARFALGGPDDVVVVGDWDGDGLRTPALLAAGQLVVFDRWPPPEGALEGRVVASVAGASGLAVVRGGDGLDRPSVARAGAADLVLEARP